MTNRQRSSPLDGRGPGRGLDQRHAGPGRRLLLAVAAVVFCAAAASPSVAMDDDEAVEAGRAGLKEPVRYPWYDKQADDVRRVKVPRPPAPPKAGDWEFKEPASRPATRTRWSLWEIFLEMLLYLAYGVLIAVLIGTILLLVRAFMRSELGAGRSQKEVSVGTDEDVDRVEALPFQVRRPKGDLLAEARRQYEAGNYGEAIIYFYSYLLVELDKSHLIRLTRGKTNRQYLREIRRQPSLHELLGMTMVAFEDVFFGHHRLQRDRFEQCYHRLDEFQAQLQEAAV
jgi:hypothetical protein